MISLKPREQFMILRQLGDHTDLTTYYVRAVIRNSVSGATIETINLTDGNDRRFYKLWEVPSDVSGEGFYIDITTSVYTDSGYTTKASGYADDLEQYLVFDRVIKTGGGGGVDVDYKKIEKILAKAIQPLEKTESINLAPVLDEIRGVLGAVKSIKIPNPEKMDHTPVLNLIADTGKKVLKAIEDKPVTPETELSGLEKAVMEAIKEKEPNLEKVYEIFDEIKEKLTNFIEMYSSKEEEKDKNIDEKVKKINEAILPILQIATGAGVGGRKVDERVSRLLESPYTQP